MLFLNCFLLKWVEVIIFRGVEFIFVFEFCILVKVFWRCILEIIILMSFWIVFGLFVVMVIFWRFLKFLIIFLWIYCGLFLMNFIRYWNSLSFVMRLWLWVWMVFLLFIFSVVDEKNVFEMVKKVNKIIRLWVNVMYYEKFLCVVMR